MAHGTGSCAPAAKTFKSSECCTPATEPFKFAGKTSESAAKTFEFAAKSSEPAAKTFEFAGTSHTCNHFVFTGARGEKESGSALDFEMWQLRDKNRKLSEIIKKNEQIIKKMRAEFGNTLRRTIKYEVASRTVEIKEHVRGEYRQLGEKLRVEFEKVSSRACAILFALRGEGRAGVTYVKSLTLNTKPSRRGAP